MIDMSQFTDSQLIAEIKRLERLLPILKNERNRRARERRAKFKK